MGQALFVSSNTAQLSDLENAFRESEMGVDWADSGSAAISRLGERSFDLIIADAALADMTGLELAEKAIRKNPFNNVAVVSTLSSEDFHEASEGLGILMQLPPRPGKAEAENLLKRLEKIRVLTGKATVTAS